MVGFESHAGQDWGGRDLSWRVRTGTRIALGFLGTPGVRLTTDVAVLYDFSLFSARITAVLEAAGLRRTGRQRQSPNVTSRDRRSER